MELLLLIIIPLSAGLLGLFLKTIPSRIYKLILALSGGFVLAMCFLHLLPHVYELATLESNRSKLVIGMAILAGFLVQIGLEWLTGGIEHGHAHDGNVGKFPIGLLGGLCFHALIEGLPLYDHGHEHSHLFLSVLVHKFPVALILVVVFKSYGLSNLKSFLYLLLFTLMAPLGIWISSIFGDSLENIGYVMLLISGLVIGVLLHISTTILFEAGENHKYNLIKLLMIVLGFFLAYVTCL